MHFSSKGILDEFGQEKFPSGQNERESSFDDLTLYSEEVTRLIAVQDNFTQTHAHKHFLNVKIYS